MTDFQISLDEYQKFHDYLESHCGIVLGANRQYLVSSRLSQLCQQKSIASMDILMAQLTRGAGRLRADIIDAMTTNETSWFRDTVPFGILGQVIFEDLQARRVSDARIWSAACSSGQEPYSISMVLDEFVRAHPMTLSRASILATDISSKMLAMAKCAQYNEYALASGLSDARRKAHFESREDIWCLKRHITKRVQFREMNLLQNFAVLGKFDVIFCRNVLIYFSQASRQSIIERFWQVLRPGGYLLLGGAETPSGSESRFESKMVNKYMYYKKK